MQHFKSLSVLMITASLFLFPLTSLAHLTVDCNDSFVTPHPTQLIIDVLPTGVDDTQNIQCALDEAAKKGIPIVRLGKGDFAISNIFIKNFKGSFQGTTRADTRLAILDNSIDCSAINSDGRLSAAIKFDGGEPKLKFMTISSDRPCMLTTTIRAIVHFTGENAFEPGCKNDVIFAQVDRVDMLGPGRRSDLLQAAIHASPEGMYKSGSCKMTLLGTFKVNQSNITGYEIGVLSSMKASAQVDINFNSFTDNRISVYLVDSNQSTTITGNTFTSQNDSEDISGLNAIKVQTRLNSAPAKTRVVVHNNRFMITDVEEVTNNFHRGNVFDVKFSGSVQDVSLSLTGNRFQVTGKNLFIIDIREIDNWVISGNLFSGAVRLGIAAEAFIDSSVSGGVIVANSFLNLNSEFTDILLGQATTKCIVGPGQNAAVVNDGTANTVL
jgi:hypothetical protein